MSHSVWKSQKKSHSSWRAKRATVTFWVDKSSVKIAKNGPIWRVFWKPKAFGQTELTDRSVLILQKLVEYSNATFWVILKHCTKVAFSYYFSSSLFLFWLVSNQKKRNSQVSRLDLYSILMYLAQLCNALRSTISQVISSPLQMPYNVDTSIFLE